MAAKQADNTYKAVVPVTGNVNKVNAYLSQGEAKYFHPTSGVKDYNDMYSTINTGDINVEFDNEYTITYTGWDYNKDDWSHAWFTYTFTEGKPSGDEPGPTPPAVLGTVTLYFSFGGEAFENVSSLSMAINGSWKSANKQGDGRYKAEFPISAAVTAVNAYFVEGSDQYRHPTSGEIDWNTDYSVINTGSVTVEEGNSYEIAWTGWHYHYDNWQHAWFNYTFTKLAA